MTDPTPQTPEAVEAETNGERPDRGRTADTLGDALTGSGMGSDTRAGSLQGGAATGSDEDTDQASVDRAMARQGRASAEQTAASSGEAEDLATTSAPADQADAATP